MLESISTECSTEPVASLVSEHRIVRLSSKLINVSLIKKDKGFVGDRPSSQRHGRCKVEDWDTLQADYEMLEQ